MTDPAPRHPPLARSPTTQSTWVADRLRALGHDVELVEVTTEGDRDRTTPLAQLGGTGVFVSALRTRPRATAGSTSPCTRSRTCPPTPDPATTVAAVPTREDPRDALVARDGLTLGELPAGATVGTGSPRRRAQLAALGLGLEWSPTCAATSTPGCARSSGGPARRRRPRRAPGCAASAGSTRPPRLLDPLQMLPAPGQGALAVEVPGRRRGHRRRRRRARRRRHPRLHDRGARAARRPRGRVLRPGRRARRGRRGRWTGPSCRCAPSSRPPTARPTCAAPLVGDVADAAGLGRRLAAAPARGRRRRPHVRDRPPTRRPPPTTSLRSVHCEPHALDHPAPLPRDPRHGSPSSGPAPATPACSRCVPASCSPRADAVVIDQVAREAVVDRWCRPDVEVVDAGHGDHGERADPRRRAPSSSCAPRRPTRRGLVVRLMDGDPAVFNGLAEEALACDKAGIAFEVVPGVSSVTAVPSYAGVPLTSSATTGSPRRRRGRPRVRPVGAARPERHRRRPRRSPRPAAQTLDALVAAGRDPQTPGAPSPSAARAPSSAPRHDARRGRRRHGRRGSSPCWPSSGPL